MAEISPVVQGLLNIHKIISRGLNVSIRKCDGYLGSNGIPSGESEGFTKYIKTLRWVTHAHHLSEDELVFPFFKDRIEAPFDNLLEDHKNMSVILDRIDSLLPDLSSGNFNRLREVLGELDDLWGDHIRIEEEHFKPLEVNSSVSLTEQAALVAKLGEHGVRNSGPGPLAVPFMIYNLEPEDRRIFLSHFPWIVRKILIPFVWRKEWKPMIPFLL